MPGLPSPTKIAGGVASAIGDAFPTNTTTTTTGDSHTSGEQNTNFNNLSYNDLTTWLSQLLHGTTSQSGTNTTSFNLDPATQQLLTQLLGKAGGLTQPFNTQAYEANQTQNINRNADLQTQAVQNINAARGVQGPAAATGLANVEQGRFANINQMQAQTPFVKQQFDLSNLAAALNVFGQAPKSTTVSNTGQTQTDTSQNTHGNNVSHGAASGTGYQSNQQATNTNQVQNVKSGGGIGGFMRGLGGVLASF